MKLFWFPTEHISYVFKTYELEKTLQQPKSNIIALLFSGDMYQTFFL